MNQNAETAESLLAADIEELRTRYPNTQELYREVCAVMFFRYGMTPTANRLYQLVRKGSMSAPAEALNRFWSQLREKSRVVIEQPDLPDELKNIAGELVAAVWKSAQQAAAASLSSFRADAQAQADEARQQADAARLKQQALADSLGSAQQAIAAGKESIAGLQQQLAELGALHASQTARLDDARKDLNAQHAWLNTVQRDHKVELDKLRDKFRLDLEVADNARKHALQEVDRERQASNRLQHQLDKERAAAGEAHDRHRAELRAALTDVAGLREQLGALQATAASAASVRDDLREQLVAMTGQLEASRRGTATAEARAAALESELRHAGALFEARLAAAQAESTGVRRPIRKSGS